MKYVKMLGAALAAVLALSGLLGLSSASASRFISPASPAKVTGEGTLFFNFSGIQYVCGVEFEATVTSPTPELKPSAQVDKNCYREVLGNKISATLELNGCVFSYHAGAAWEEGSGYAMNLGLGSAGCGPIVLSEPSCVRKFSAPQTIGGGTVRNEKNEKGRDVVRIEPSSAGFEFSQEGSLCEKGTFKSSSITGSILAQAKDKAGTFVNFDVSDEAGVFLGGKGFEAEEYPVEFTGVESPTNQFYLNYTGREIQCAIGGFSGEESAATSELGLEGYADNCSWTVLGNHVYATVLMNGCSLALNSGGKFGFSCPVGKTIEIKGYTSLKNKESGTSACTYYIGNQSALTGVSYTSSGAGMSRSIGVAVNTAGLAVTAGGTSELLCGKYSGGSATFKVGSTLHGVLK